MMPANKPVKEPNAARKGDNAATIPPPKKIAHKTRTYTIHTDSSSYTNG